MNLVQVAVFWSEKDWAVSESVAKKKPEQNTTTFCIATCWFRNEFRNFQERLRIAFRGTH